MKIADLTASQIKEMIEVGKLSSLEVAKAFLVRIDKLDSKLKAWVRVDSDTVLEDARNSDQKRAQGSPVGKLEGVPIGIKDIFYTKGIPTTACSKVYRDFVPEYDAKAVQMVKEAGAIMLGKTVTTEFAWTDPSPTKNPWNIDHTPGGSSSGSAVAVATKMCPIAFGSQTVGSVLRPASYSGVVGFKPTFQSVSREGLIPFSPSSDTVGWMSRSVDDAALLWEVLGESNINSERKAGRKSDYHSSPKESVGPICIGMIGDFFLEESDYETQVCFRRILEKFVAAGATVVETFLPKSFENLAQDVKTITEVEGAAFHREMFQADPSSYGPLLATTIENGLSTKKAQYQDALGRQTNFSNDMENLAKSVDFLITPTTPSPAPPDVSNTGNGMFQAPWSASGLPSISLPSGLSKNGLPLGVQLIGRTFGDKHLLERAMWCEETMGIELTPLV